VPRCSLWSGTRPWKLEAGSPCRDVGEDGKAEHRRVGQAARRRQVGGRGTPAILSLYPSSTWSPRPAPPSRSLASQRPRPRRLAARPRPLSRQRAPPAAPPARQRPLPRRSSARAAPPALHPCRVWGEKKGWLLGKDKQSPQTSHAAQPV
jgi:hypothetical protein